MSNSHAILSPSSSHRWLNCTPSARLEEHEKDDGSDFAKEGTLAHAYCARALKQHLGLNTKAENDEIASLVTEYYSNEMMEYVDTYKTIVLEKYNAALAITPDARLLVEQRLDFSNYIEESFGTADAIIIADGVMEVIDFKYGKGVKVDAHENPQMMIYALGALALYDLDYNIHHVRMTIVQPRIDNLSEYELQSVDLLQWATLTLQPQAKKAYRGEGDQRPGAWCRFCKVKARCKAIVAMTESAMELSADPQLLTNEDIATHILPWLPTVKSWLKDIEDYALAKALTGEHLPGWKLVEGRSIRKITDQDKAAEAMKQNGMLEANIWKPRELRTITELEKFMGKKLFASVCAPYINKPAGKPTLVEESDKRQAIDPAKQDFQGINIEREYND